MRLEFKVYELKKETKSYKQLVEILKNPNEFIITGEEENNYKTHPILDNGIILVDGFKLNEMAFIVNKDDLELKSFDGYATEIQEFDIPKKYLTLSVVEDIKRLNE